MPHMLMAGLAAVVVLAGCGPSAEELREQERLAEKRQKERIVRTQETIAEIGQAITVWSLDHSGKFPDELAVLTVGEGDEKPLIEGGKDALNDAWGNPIGYERRGKRFKLVSSGPDGRLDTSDDISNLPYLKKNR